MKSKIIPIASLFIFMLIFFSCEDSTYREYTGYKPEYLSYEDLRSGVSVGEPVEIINPGKVYFKDDYIFVVEEMEGIHVIDNSDPAQPERVSYVKVPGVMDISISGFHMYADSYVDLVVLDVENPLDIKVEARVEDVLPYVVPPHENDYQSAWVDSEKGVVTGWELTTIRERVDYTPIVYPFYRSSEDFSLTNLYGGTISGSGVGVGGSMARFGIRENVLYIVNNSSMNIFDISSPSNPVEYDEIYPGWGIETMFINGDYMYLGSTTGMVIFDLSVKFSPSWVSSFWHARSCDPVVIDGNLAYITLRTGTNCGGNINTLDVVDISDITDPDHIASFPMFNPHGLGKDGNLLFICDGAQGLKVFDADDPLNITDNLLYSYPGIDAYDVIPLGNVLILVGDNGLFQYDYSDPSDITLLSQLFSFTEK